MGQRARFPVDSVFLSARGRGELRRTATVTPLVHEGPRRSAKNCNGYTFCPQRTRRATENGNFNGNFFFSTKGREELQRLHLLSTKGREGPRRTATATATPFVRGGHGGGGELPGFFWAAEGRGVRQLQRQHLYPRRTRRTTENCNCNTLGPRRAAEGHCGRRGDGGGDWCGRGEAWFWRGALRGRSPCTREAACGRPPRTAVVSDQWLVVSGTSVVRRTPAVSRWWSVD